MRHVLFVQYTAGPSGPTSSLLLLLDGLRDRFRMSVAHPPGGDLSDRLRARGIGSIELPDLGVGAVRALARIVREQGIDLVYANNTGGASRNAWLAARFTDTPFVSHVRGMSATRGWRKLFYLRYADAVIAVSHAAASGVRRYAGSAPVYVVYNGVPLPEEAPGAGPTPGRAQVRSSLGLAEEAVVFLQAAHVCPRKGQMFAVEVWPQVVGDLPSAVLLVAGGLEHDPDYTDSLRKRIQDDRMSDCIRLLGFRSDVPHLLDASDVFLHTATADPHPRAVIEAMARGLPVVAFAVDGVAETVVDGDTGHLVPAGDHSALRAALVDLGSDPETRERMGRAGRERARSSFSARSTANQVGDVLERVLGPRPAPSDFEE